MKFAGRSVVIGSAPVPHSMRVGPDVVVMTFEEVKAIAGGDTDTAAAIRRAIDDYDRERLRATLERAGGQ